MKIMLNGALIGTLALAGPAQAADRMAGNEDSWMALAYMLTALLVGAGLATSLYHYRKSALAAAGVMAFAVSAGIGFAKWSGYLEHFRPVQTVLDPFKLALLYAFMALAAVTGAFLFYVASRPEQDVPPPAQRYNFISRLLHWSTAIIFVSLVPLGIFMAGLPMDEPLREPLYLIHKSLGMTILVLVLVRLGLHLIHPVPPLSSDLNRMNRVAAKAAHWALYLLMLAFPITGYFLSSYIGKIVPLYFLDLPVLVEASKSAIAPFVVLHKVALPLILGLVLFLHIAGAVKHHFIDKHTNAIRRMLG